MKNRPRVPSALCLCLLAALAGTVAHADSAGTTPAEEQITYNRDVAPIFYEHCITCHRPGRIAPMSLLDYESTRPWAKSIKKQIEGRLMPPWHADSSSVRYANDRSLSKQEIDTIIRWVDHGARRGDPSTGPSPPASTEGWMMGEPDMVFHATSDFTIPALQDDVEYQNIVFDTSSLTEDVYISQWEIKPSVMGAIHHANLSMSPKPFDPDSGVDMLEQAAMARGDYIGSYLPGKVPTRFADGMAYKLPANSYLAIEVHYIGQEEEVTDHLEFGVKFADGRVDKMVRVVGTDDRDINIPPHDPSWEMVGQIRLLHDLLVLSSGAHMHLRGKDYTMEILPPSGPAKLVTRVPKYDFNWQSIYWLAEPVFAPKGSTLRTTAHWDNSANNPHNPAPDEWARYGLWTTNEMLNSYAHVIVANERLGLKILNGRLAGKFEDAQSMPHPWLLQTPPGSAFRTATNSGSED